MVCIVHARDRFAQRLGLATSSVGQLTESSIKEPANLGIEEMQQIQFLSLVNYVLITANNSGLKERAKRLSVKVR